MVITWPSWVDMEVSLGRSSSLVWIQQLCSVQEEGSELSPNPQVSSKHFNDVVFRTERLGSHWYIVNWRIIKVRGRGGVQKIWWISKFFHIFYTYPKIIIFFDLAMKKALKNTCKLTLYVKYIFSSIIVNVIFTIFWFMKCPKTQYFVHKIFSHRSSLSNCGKSNMLREEVRRINLFVKTYWFIHSKVSESGVIFFF